MKKAMLMTLVVLMVGAFVSGGLVQTADAKPAELKIWCAWIPDTFSAEPFLHIFMDKVNKKGKAADLSIKLIGGPEVFKDRDGINALRDGVIDAAYTAAVYHASVVPEARAMMLSQLTPMEERKSGAYDMMNKFHQEKAGVYFLFRLSMQPYFQFYLNDALDKVDFKGLKLRSTPAYDAIIKKLGGAIVRTSMAEAYTAMDRGMVNGYGYPVVGLIDHKLEEVTKYVWGPSFYSSPTGVFINHAKWNSLSQAQRDVLTEAGKEMEIESADIFRGIAKKERDQIIKAGVKVYKLSPEKEKQLLDITQDAGWGVISEKAPDAMALRPLMSK
ncbi:TRAP transporter substrate-binding protein DctP [Thermodesulfobacteriota bacterium]